MQRYTYKNSPTTQVAISLCLAATGVLCLFLASRTPTANGYAGAVAGLLLLGIGAGGVGFVKDQTVTIDFEKKQIRIRGASRFKVTTRTISSADILRTGIGFNGKRSSGVMLYYVVMHLRDGSQYNLFAHGFFKGMMDEQTALERQNIVNRLIQA